MVKNCFKKITAVFMAIVMLVSVLPIQALGVDALTEGQNALSRGRDGLAAAGTLVEQAERAAEENGMRLWFTKPAKNWTSEGILIGNGYFGSVLFGGVEKDQIHINEKTLWTGGPGSVKDYDGGNRSTPVTQASLDALREKMETNFANNGSGVSSGAGVNQMYGELAGQGSYQDFGDIWVDWKPAGQSDALASNYVRDLDLNTGISSVNYDLGGVSYRREYFSSYPDKVQVYSFAANHAGKQSFDVSMSCYQTGGNAPTIVAEGNTITMAGALNADNGMKYEAQLRVVATGGTCIPTADGKIEVRDADRVEIIMASGTDYKNDYPVYRGEDPHMQITENLDKAVKKGLRNLRNDHIADHYGLFSRVSFDLGARIPEIPTNELVVNYRKGEFDPFLDTIMFQMGRYLTIAGSRPGTLPLNLQGLWGVGGMTWGGDYHFNMNLQINYWQVYSANLAECAIPLVEYIDSLREPGRVTAGVHHAVLSEEGEENGWIVHTSNNPFGLTAPSESQEWALNMGGAPWILQSVYDYYRFTGDKDYLREMIYPAMREQTVFWDQYLVKSERQDRYVVSPSFSAELGPTVIGATYDQSLVWELYKQTIAASEILGVDEDLRKNWNEKMEGLKPIQIGNDGQIKEWFEETQFGKCEVNGVEKALYNFNAAEYRAPHRHLSHMVGLYPGTLINKEDPSNIAAARISLDQRGYEDTTGFSKAHRACAWARTMDGNKAYRNIQALLTQDARGTMTNLLGSVGASQPAALANAGRLFQSEGNTGYTAGVAEMLLQSHLGYIQPLPAIPDAWPSGSAQGLLARGNFVCDMTWSDEILSELTITSQIGGACVVEYPGIENAVIRDAAGKEVASVKVAENRISFATEKGGKYTVTGISGAVEAGLIPPAAVRAYRTAADKIELTWDAVPNATEYVVYRQKLQTVASDKLSAGSLYGEGYEKLATVDGAMAGYVDEDVVANSVCGYMVAVKSAAGRQSSGSVPVMTKPLLLSEAIAAGEAALAKLDTPLLQGLKLALNAQLEAARTITDNDPLALRETAYFDLTATSEKCDGGLELSGLLIEAADLLERTAPGPEQWRCPQELRDRLNDAEQSGLALLDAGIDTYSTEEIALFTKSLNEAVLPVRNVFSRLTVEIAPAGTKLKTGDRLTLRATVEDPSLRIHYTLDGTRPTANSAVYEGPLTVQKAGDVMVTAGLFCGDNAVSEPVEKRYLGENLARGKTVTSSWAYWGENYAPGKVTDGSTSGGNRWASDSKSNAANTPGADLVIDLGESLDVSSVFIYEATDESMGVRVLGYELYATNDLDGDWTKVYTGGKIADVPSCNFKTINARYIKFVATAVTNMITLKEVEVYGAARTAEFSDKEVTLQLGKTALLVQESVRLNVNARTGAGMPILCDAITYADNAPADSVVWNGASLTLEKPCAPFEVWAECTIGENTFVTQKQTIRTREPNLALGKAVSAAFERSSPPYPASYAVDGARSSMWGTYGSPAAAMPPNLWYQIDFGTSETFDKVVLEEFASYDATANATDTQTITAFTLEVSEDAKTWMPIFELKKGEAPTGYDLKPLDPSNGAKYGRIARPDGAVAQNCTVDNDGNVLTADHTVVLEAPAAGRYLKLTVTDAVADMGTPTKLAYVTLHEFSVYNTKAVAKPYADTPYADPASCSFTEKQAVSLHAPDAGAVIYYTLDGSEPTAQSPIYETPLEITQDTTLRAIAIVAGYETSAIAQFEYTKKQQTIIPDEPVELSKPTASLAAGNYQTMQTVTLFGGDGATIRYTLDGSNPSRTAGRLYVGPLKLAANKTLRAIAYHGDEETEISEFQYTITLASAPALVASVTLDRLTMQLASGMSLGLKATILPATAAQTNLRWSSSNPAVASVDANGTVRAVGAGATTITAAAGAYKLATCLAFVTEGPRGGTGGAPMRYSITATQSDGGVISPTGITVDKGADTAFTIKADAGYIIKDVLVDDLTVGAVNCYTFKQVSKNHTIRAVFEKLSAMAFADIVADSWYYEAVKYVYENGLMNGTSAQTFSPNATTTRGMIMTMLFRQAGEPFVEAEGSQWYAKAQTWAMANDLSDGSHMDGAITREQLATLLHRYAAFADLALVGAEKLDQYSDADGISAYAEKSMQWAVGNGLIQGKPNGTLAPQGNATRAEVATILMRFCKKAVK